MSAVGRIQFGNVFLAGPSLYVMMQSLIDWLNECSRHLPSTIARPWTAPVSVLGHNWPTFSLFLPVQSSLFTLLWAEFFWFFQCPKGQGGGAIISEWPSYMLYVDTRMKLQLPLEFGGLVSYPDPGTEAGRRGSCLSRFRQHGNAKTAEKRPGNFRRYRDHYCG